MYLKEDLSGFSFLPTYTFGMFFVDDYFFIRWTKVSVIIPSPCCTQRQGLAFPITQNQNMKYILLTNTCIENQYNVFFH